MARGNQRENDREKAQKKLGNQKKPTESGSSLAARKALDTERMKQKEALAAEKKAAEAAIIAAGGTVPVINKNPGTKAPIKK